MNQVGIIMGGHVNVTEQGLANPLQAGMHSDTVIEAHRA
ncbi:hypothetical protein KIPB_016139, partial [Kipferlia bialata]|eukprot:g16139.t1